jgi:hypothetical protein
MLVLLLSFSQLPHPKSTHLDWLSAFEVSYLRDQLIHEVVVPVDQSGNLVGHLKFQLVYYCFEVGDGHYVMHDSWGVGMGAVQGTNKRRFVASWV